ncbi:MAG: hypothetical protein Q9187_007849, partial [Circinaria calcarea]
MWDSTLLILTTALVTSVLTVLLTFSLVRTIVITSSGKKTNPTEKLDPTEEPTPTKESTSAKEPSLPKYPGLYRAQGIPLEYSKDSVKWLLHLILACEEDSLVIHSLADDPRGKPTKVAAFTLIGGSEHLSGRGRRWTFPVPKEECPSRNTQSPLVSIDDHFEGFTPMNSFKTSEEHKIDFIAISGLGSNAYGSFVERGGTHMWLAGSLPYDIPGIRVLTYGYDSHLHNSDSFQDLEAISSSFRTNIGTIRPKVDVSGIGNYQSLSYSLRNQHDIPPKPLIFLGHSLGGVILKMVFLSIPVEIRGLTNLKALVQMNNSAHKIDKENFLSTYAALFFGVPNQGMDIGSLIPMAGGQNLPMLMNLGKESELLRGLHREFLSNFTYKTSRIISYYETKVSPTAIQVDGRWKMKGKRVVLVSQSSATHGRPWENQPHHIQAINRSHSNLVKFSSDDEVYDRILVRLKEFAEDSIKVIQRRFEDNADLSHEQHQCLRDLNRPRFWEIRDTKIHQPEPGTLRWLYKTPEFQSWRDNEHFSTLWIRGSPGQGKSVLAKAVINHLDEWSKLIPRDSSTSITNLGSVKVIYFFFYKQDEEKTFSTPQSLIRALIVQLLTASRIFEHLPRTYQARPGEFFTERFGTLWNIFCDLVCDPLYSRIYCVIDALDECEESVSDLLSGFKKVFSGLMLNGRLRLKLLITTRPMPDLANELDSSPCIDLKAKTEDLKLFVQKKISNLPQRFGPELKGKATELLLGRTERTFLWVSIVTNKIERMVLPSFAKLTTAVAESSTDLDELYSDITYQVMRGPLEGQKLLAWAAYSRRPLTLIELEAALATQIGSESKESTEDYRANLTKDAVASTAGVILEITADTVHLIHQSAKDFILKGNQLANSPFLCGLGLAGS